MTVRTRGAWRTRSWVNSHRIAAVAAARRQAADEVRLGVGDDARQDGDAEAGAHPGQQPGRRGMVHRHLVLEAEAACSQAS